MAKLLEITGKAISGEWGQDDDTGTGIPVLRTTNFTNEGFVNYKNVVTRSISKKNIAEKYLRHGDVIIEKSGGSDKQPVGRVIFFEGEENKYLFNNFTGLLRVQNPEEWLPKYVFYALYAYYRNGGTRAFENRTTGLHNLQVDNYVKSVDIPKLSYRKQQHICETLDHVRDAVAYRERQLTKLDELVKARFVEMFGDPDQNPKGWPLVSITEIIRDKASNGFFAKRDAYKDDGNVQILGVSNVVNRMYSNTKELPRTDATQAEKEKYSVKYGDMLFCRSSLVADGIGKASIVAKGTFPNVLFECHVIRLSLDLQKCVPEFVQVLSTTPFFRRQIIAQSKTATMTTIGQDGILKSSVVLPPIDLQNQFADFVAEVDKSKLLAELFAQSTCILAENHSK